MNLLHWPLISCLLISCHGKSLESQKDDCCSKVRIVDANSRITNPSFPKPDSKATSYRYLFDIQESVCGLRLTFEKTRLEMRRGMSSPTCTVDSVTVIAQDFPNEPQCGNLESFQINVPTEAGRTVEVLVVTQSKKHLWSIIASQLPCSNIESRPLEKYSDKCGQRPDNFFNIPFVKEQGEEKEGEAIITENDEPLVDMSSISNDDMGSTSTNDPDLSNCAFGGNYLRCYLDHLVNNYSASVSPLIISKIVNGQIVKRPWPWQIVMLVKGKHLLCGGALISPSVFLTAGHCIQAIQRSIGLKQVIIAAGINRLGVPHFQAQFRRCGRAVINSQYADVHNDIGLCFFDEPMELNDRISPVCLPTNQSELYAGDEAYITGFGKTSDKSGPSSVLYEAPIPIVKNSACQNAWVEMGGPQFSNLITASHLCAGGQNKSTCNGDSGGPIVVKDLTRNDRYTLVGVTSFGPSTMCNVPNKPLSVFTRISTQLKFIALATAKSFDGDYSNVKKYIPCEN